MRCVTFIESVLSKIFFLIQVGTYGSIGILNLEIIASKTTDYLEKSLSREIYFSLDLKCLMT